MNALDRVVGWIDPVAGAKRAAARLALRAYDAARPQRSQDSWLRRSTGAASEVEAGAGRVRDAVRDLVRNNGYAQRALSTLVSSHVSTGIVGTASTAARGEVNQRAARDAFARFADNCDHEGHNDLYGLQVLAARTMFESGEALVRFRRLPFDGNVRTPPLTLQILEPDHVDTAKNSLGGTGALIDRGIEYDRQGRKVALWLLPYHPGDSSRYMRTRFDSVRVPIGEIEQVYDRLRPGQDRGISLFAGAVLPLKDLADYFQAELMRKRIEACLAVFVTSDGDGAGVQLGVPAGTDVVDGPPLRRLTPGLIHELKQGQSVETLTPGGTGEITPFVDQLLFLSAAAGGVMFEHMTGNFKNVNYSSYRVGSHDYARAVAQRQWTTLRPRLLLPIQRRFAEAALAANLVRAASPEDITVSWGFPPATTSPDPVKDAKANEANLAMGLTSRRALVGEAGWSPSELNAEIAQDMEEADAMGVMFVGDPRRSANGQAQPAPPQQQGETDADD